MKRLLWMLVAAMTMVSCHKDDPNLPDAPNHYGRTVMMYMAMQNSLGSSKYHKADSTEVVQAMEYIPANDRMLLFIDDAQRPRLYELSRELSQKDPKTGMPFGPKLVKEWKTDVSSASAETVTEVLEYMRKNYDSDSYGLIMGSHATGWLPTDRSTSSNNSNCRAEATTEGSEARTTKNDAARGPKKTFGIDVGADGSMASDHGVAGSVADQIEIDDLASAIMKSGVKLSYLLFDACLMQNIEVDYALRGVTDYIIASPISISAEGAYYTDLVREGLFSANVTDVARVYASYYLGQGSIPYTDGYGTVISCVRTEGLERFAAAMRSMLHEVTMKMDSDETDMVEVLKGADMSGAFNYQAYAKNYYYRPHNYDIISAMETLGLDAIQMRELRMLLAELVPYSAATTNYWIGPGYWTMQPMPANHDEWCGVSMFVPQEIYSQNASVCTSYGDLNEDFKETQWYKAVFGASGN